MSVVGIDFGNLNTVIAVARNRGIDVICNEVSNRATPSLVSFGPKQRYIGESAKTQEISNFKNTVASIKRLIGRPFSDSEIHSVEANWINSALVEGERGEVASQVSYVDYSQHTFTSTELVGMFFTQVKQITQNELKIPVSDCVISCPGWFTDSQRRHLMDAAEIAGLNPLRILSDLTAAALGYGITKLDLPEPETKPRTVCFVDVGHSNTQVAIVQFWKGKLVVKGTGCDRNLGGRDFDELLARHFAEEFKGKYKIDIASNQKAMHRLRSGCEKVKKILSANSVTMLNVECIMNDKDVSATVERSLFVDLAKDLVERIHTPLNAALHAAGVAPEEVDFVEIVGGSTRIPAIKELLANCFGAQKLSTTLNQDEAIARGCALQCAILSPVFKVRDFSITDSNNYSVSISWDPKVCPPDAQSHTLQPFPVASSIPSTKLFTFYRKLDTKTPTFDIQIDYDKENLTTRAFPAGLPTKIGTFRVEGLKAYENKEVAAFKVKAKLSGNGIVKVTEAWQTEEIEVPVEETKETPMETDEKPASSDKSPEGSTEDMSTQEPAAPAPVPEKPKTKKITRRHDLKITSMTSSLSTDIIQKYREAEGKMVATDALVVATANARNELESYVYEVRDKIEEGGQWFEYSDAKVRETLKGMLTQMEDWLYTEEGEEATKSVYVEKFNSLKVYGNPMQQRYREAEDRPRAEKALREYINSVMISISAGDDRYAHIDAKDMEKVRKETEKKLSWLNDVIGKQNASPKSADLVVTSEQIMKERDILSATVNPILSKPKPAPPKEEPKKEEPKAGEKKEETPMETDEKKEEGRGDEKMDVD